MLLVPTVALNLHLNRTILAADSVRRDHETIVRALLNVGTVLAWDVEQSPTILETVVLKAEIGEYCR